MDSTSPLLRVKYHQAPDTTPHHGDMLVHDAVVSAYVVEAKHPKTITTSWLAKNVAVLTLAVCNVDGVPTMPVRNVKHLDDETRDVNLPYWTEA